MRVAALLGFVAIILLAQEPNKDPDSFDIEPPLLIPNREDEQLSNPKPESAPGRDVDLAKLEKELERARKNAASAERLCKIGALSKLEAEQRVLRCVHLEFDLANARLVCAKEEMLKKEKQATAGEIAKTDLAQSETGLALARDASGLRLMRPKPMCIARKNFSRSAERENRTSNARRRNLPSLNRTRSKFADETRCQIGSVTGGHSVFARFAPANVDALAIVHLNLDRLITAVAAGIDTHVVAALF